MLLRLGSWWLHFGTLHGYDRICAQDLRGPPWQAGLFRFQDPYFFRPLRSHHPSQKIRTTANTMTSKKGTYSPMSSPSPIIGRFSEPRIKMSHYRAPGWLDTSRREVVP